MRSRSGRAAASLLLMAVAFALLGGGAAVARSLIPVAVDAEVRDIEVRREKHPGIDDVWLVHLDGGRTHHVDAETGRRMAVGAYVSKAAWDTALRIDGESVPLRLSADALRMLWVMPLTVLAAAFSAATSVRRPLPDRRS